ncbi:MAG: hypothetical protein KA712_05105 [Myxococcales bacterium]|nr:hypothetical protein [Myxococcales bacterium]
MPRLDRLLARTLGASRKEVTLLLRKQRVRLADGQCPRDGALAIDTASLPCEVWLDGEAVMLRDRFHLLLNKPAGHVTALKDREHPIAASLVQDAPLFEDLRAVGRLDKDTTGLLLWTTDGQLLHRLTHPRAGVPRTYQAALARPPSPVPGDFVLDDGHRPTIVALAALSEAERHPALICPPETATLATITIVGGAYHEVRRIFAALGSHVLGLCRVAYGPIALPPDLADGAWLALESLPDLFPLKPPVSGTAPPADTEA